MLAKLHYSPAFSFTYEINQIPPNHTRREGPSKLPTYAAIKNWRSLPAVAAIIKGRSFIPKIPPNQVKTLKGRGVNAARKTAHAPHLLNQDSTLATCFSLNSLLAMGRPSFFPKKYPITAPTTLPAVAIRVMARGSMPKAVMGAIIVAVGTGKMKDSVTAITKAPRRPQVSTNPSKSRMSPVNNAMVFFGEGGIKGLALKTETKEPVAKATESFINLLLLFNSDNI